MNSSTPSLLGRPLVFRDGWGRRLRTGVAVVSVLALLAWMAQGVMQDPKLDTSNTVLPLKAQYLFQFAKGNDWPAEVKQGPFTIAVHDNEDLVEELASKYAMQPIGAQTLQIVNLEGSVLKEHVHMLYTEAQGAELSQLLSATLDLPVLVVTSTQDGIPMGAVINFLSQEGFIKYELDVQRAEARGLLVGNRILSWAVVR
ncbi:MAG: YfiR family protein [Bacteroidetes bacterium]|nr:YfiR family protein [Bacteroidota bacterium]MDA0904414.1 YfiR family protein [Bacteroidota bacterium]MDA1243352.1 YfiR family protein [Bacteroidota bacterium]